MFNVNTFIPPLVYLNQYSSKLSNGDAYHELFTALSLNFYISPTVSSFLGHFHHELLNFKETN